jgi:hypothetical protein
MLIGIEQVLDVAVVVVDPRNHATPRRRRQPAEIGGNTMLDPGAIGTAIIGLEAIRAEASADQQGTEHRSARRRAGSGWQDKVRAAAARWLRSVARRIDQPVREPAG